MNEAALDAELRLPQYATMSFEAAIHQPSPLIGEPNWAGRFSAEQLRDKRGVIDAMLAQIEMILGVKD